MSIHQDPRCFSFSIQSRFGLCSYPRTSIVHAHGFSIVSVSYTHLDVYKRQNLERLLESGQFELVSDKPENGKIRLIYIMNDAVESFIVFDNARLTGTYDSKFEGSVTASLTGNEKEYVMVVHQNESCLLYTSRCV